MQIKFLGQFSFFEQDLNARCPSDFPLFCLKVGHGDLGPFLSLVDDGAAKCYHLLPLHDARRI